MSTSLAVSDADNMRFRPSFTARQSVQKQVLLSAFISAGPRKSAIKLAQSDVFLFFTLRLIADRNFFLLEPQKRKVFGPTGVSGMGVFHKGCRRDPQLANQLIRRQFLLSPLIGLSGHLGGRRQLTPPVYGCARRDPGAGSGVERSSAPCNARCHLR